MLIRPSWDLEYGERIQWLGAELRCCWLQRGFTGLHAFREQAGGVCGCVCVCGCLSAFTPSYHHFPPVVIHLSVASISPHDSTFILHSLPTCDESPLFPFPSLAFIFQPTFLSFTSSAQHLPLLLPLCLFHHHPSGCVIPLCFHLSTGGFQMWACQHKGRSGGRAESRGFTEDIQHQTRRGGEVGYSLKGFAHRCQMPNTFQMLITHNWAV